MCHMTDNFGGIEIKTSESNIQISNLNNLNANAISKYRETIIQKDGKKMNIIVEKVCKFCTTYLTCFAICFWLQWQSPKGGSCEKKKGNMMKNHTEKTYQV